MTNGTPTNRTPRTRHVLEVDDLTADELRAVLDLAERADPPAVLAGQGVALVFEKPSNRTRNSTEMAVVQLGGHPVSLQSGEVGLDGRETAEDVARTLGCYHRIVCARTFAHTTLERMAAALDGAGMAVPVVNLLSDDGHPCQALADVLTIRQELGAVEGRTVAWVGDANNVARSLALAVVRLGGTMRLSGPGDFGFDDASLDRMRGAGPGEVVVLDRPEAAVTGADVVATDVWASMGQEADADARRRAFEGWTVTSDLLDLAAPAGILLHCLPAHRGEEVSADAIEGPRSRVWRQAANRMHAIRGLFLWLLQEGGG
jgi:ornithine carbamoyltransferase